MPPHNDEIAAEFQKIFSTKTRDEWLEFLRSEDIPCAPADPVTKYIDDPQVKANNMVVEIEDAERGRGRQMGIPVNLCGNPGRIKGRAPKLDEHTEEVFAELLDRPLKDINRAKTRQGSNADTGKASDDRTMHPLEGITVLDLTTMINGPYSSMLLAEMGAEIIKIEPPDGDPWRIMGAGFVGVNRGKRSIVIDLKKAEGKKIAYELAARADIVVENARWGVWHRLGLDYESVAKINPDIIYLSVTGYGPSGPYSALPGYDPLLQARSGQMVTQGGLGKPPIFHLLTINDMAGPMLGAFGVALALLAQKLNGKGQNVWTSLTNAGVVMQAHQFMDYDGVDYKDLGGSNLLGLTAIHRHYMTNDDRWLFILCANDGHWRNLCQLMRLDNLIVDDRFETVASRAVNDEALIEILSEKFLEKSSEEWMAILLRADIPVALAQGFDDILVDPHFLENDIFDEREHPELGMVKQLGLIPRFSGMSGVIRRPAPLYGQHTEEVLSELSYTDDTIAQLLEDSVVFDTPEPE